MVRKGKPPDHDLAHVDDAAYGVRVIERFGQALKRKFPGEGQRSTKRPLVDLDSEGIPLETFHNVSPPSSPIRSISPAPGQVPAARATFPRKKVNKMVNRVVDIVVACVNSFLKKEMPQCPKRDYGERVHAIRTTFSSAHLRWTATKWEFHAVCDLFADVRNVARHQYPPWPTDFDVICETTKALVACKVLGSINYVDMLEQQLLYAIATIRSSHPARMPETLLIIRPSGEVRELRDIPQLDAGELAGYLKPSVDRLEKSVQLFIRNHSLLFPSIKANAPLDMILKKIHDTQQRQIRACPGTPAEKLPIQQYFQLRPGTKIGGVARWARLGMLEYNGWHVGNRVGIETATMVVMGIHDLFMSIGDDCQSIQKVMDETFAAFFHKISVVAIAGDSGGDGREDGEVLTSDDDIGGSADKCLSEGEAGTDDEAGSDQQTNQRSSNIKDGGTGRDSEINEEEAGGVAGTGWDVESGGHAVSGGNTVSGGNAVSGEDTKSDGGTK